MAKPNKPEKPGKFVKVVKLPKTQKQTDAELLELGRKMQAFFDSGYVSRKQAIVFAFIKGIAAGLGAFLGGTIVVALLLWALGHFDHVPLVAPVYDSLQSSVQQQAPPNSPIAPTNSQPSQ